jgi:hypothetical protein
MDQDLTVYLERLHERGEAAAIVLKVSVSFRSGQSNCTQGDGLAATGRWRKGGGEFDDVFGFEAIVQYFFEVGSWDRGVAVAERSDGGVDGRSGGKIFVTFIIWGGGTIAYAQDAGEQ